MHGLLLGITAPAGAGKDTAADLLVKNSGFIKLSLADEMKRYCKVVFGFTDEQLWGPSECRNATDDRYDHWLAWHRAASRLQDTSFEWCRKLFPGENLTSLLNRHDALHEWFDTLQEMYGPKSLHSLSPRVVLQTIGTEFGRTQDDKVWVRSTTATANAVLSSNEFTYQRETGLVRLKWWQRVWRWLRPLRGAVIPDCRFKNEVDGVQDAGGIAMRLRRQPKADALTVGVKGHQSEAEQQSLPDTYFDVVLDVPEDKPPFGKYNAALHFALERYL